MKKVDGSFEYMLLEANTDVRRTTEVASLPTLMAFEENSKWTN